MSFLNTFIELSILSEELNQSNELNFHTSLLQEQNENINSLIQHQQQQDWIRDYMYRINKACEQLEKSKDKDSLDFYYSIYCLAKGINESGLSTSSISELKDKEYFDNCLDRIGILMFMYLLNILATLSKKLKYLKYFSIFYYTDSKIIVLDNKLDLCNISVILLSSIIVCILSYILYNKQETGI